MNQINLVQNDTGPDIVVTLYDPATNSPVSVADAGTVVRMYYLAEGAASAIAIVGTKTNGGADGVVAFSWPAGALASPGKGEGEIEISFNTGITQTVSEKLWFFVRKELP